MTVLELYSSPNRWTRRYFAQDAKGRSIPADHPDAVCWCLEGALWKCYGLGSLEYNKAVAKVRAALSGDDSTLWNDVEGRTFADVVDLVRRVGI